MSKPVVLLDADGVFLRTVRPGNYLEQLYGLNAAQAARFRSMMHQCLVGKADLKLELPAFLKEWKVSESAEAVLETAFSTGNQIDDAVAEVVKTIRGQGIICGLVTNQDRHRMEYLDRHLAIREHFDAVFVSCELGLKKPDADFYHVVGAHFPSKQLAFWDDRPDNVQAAKECGWTAFEFLDAAKLKADLKVVLDAEPN